MFHYNKNNNILSTACEKNENIIKTVVETHGFASISEDGVMEFFTKGIKNSDFTSGFDMTSFCVPEGHNEVDVGYWYLAHECRTPITLLEPPQYKILRQETISTIVEINLQALKDWLLSLRLSNYGYRVSDFSNLSKKASRVRGKLRNMYKGDMNLDAYSLDRVYAKYNGVEVWGVNTLLVPNAEFYYCVGQSFNEEYIRLLQQLTDNK